MSLTQRTTTISLRFRDNDGAESNCQSNSLAGDDLDDVIAYLGAWAPLVQALSSALIASAEIVQHWHDPSFGSPLSGSDSLRMGVFIFNTASSDLATIRIPAIDDSFIETTGPMAGIAIDQTNATVIALVSALTGGISGVQACDPFGSDLVSLNTAYVEQFS